MTYALVFFQGLGILDLEIADILTSTGAQQLWCRQRGNSCEEGAECQRDEAVEMHTDEIMSPKCDKGRARRYSEGWIFGRRKWT
jgi:hypothetical protein